MSNTKIMVMMTVSVTIIKDSRPRVRGYPRLIVGAYLEKDSDDATPSSLSLDECKTRI